MERGYQSDKEEHGAGGIEADAEGGGFVAERNAGRRSRRGGGLFSRRIVLFGRRRRYGRLRKSGHRPHLKPCALRLRASRLLPAEIYALFMLSV